MLLFKGNCTRKVKKPNRLNRGGGMELLLDLNSGPYRRGELGGGGVQDPPSSLYYAMLENSILFRNTVSVSLKL